MPNFPRSSQRTREQLRHHYEVEKALAQKLKDAPREQRPLIYATLYSELFAKVPDHPRLTRRDDPVATAKRINRSFRFIKNMLNPSRVYLEFGPGDCQFAFYVSRYVKHVYAVDLSPQMSQTSVLPDNFYFISYDGYQLPLERKSVDIIFSDQLIEHIHPDDITIHFQIAEQLLKPGGSYLFITPHRFSGPRDISRFFSDEAEGFHLKEWTYGEIVQILQDLGYSQWTFYRFVMNIPIRIPCSIILLLERSIASFPRIIRKILGKSILPNIVVRAIA